jgi:hypothetical protein
MKAMTGCVLAASVLGAQALPVTITRPFMNLENRAINSLGFTSGQFVRVGADSVVPNGNNGTSGIGTTVNLLTGQAVAMSLPFNPAPITPNFFARYLGANPALYGPWTLNFSNGADSASTVVSLPQGTTQAPFVNTITLSGSSTNPTFSWTPPAGTAVNGYRINIYDKIDGQVASRNFTSNVTSYTVSAADFTVPGYAFQLNRDYSIEIGLIQTRDGTSNSLNNDNLKAISRVYADFRGTQNGGPAVNLPVVLSNGSFQFNMVVQPGVTYYLDPSIATGYDFRTGDGDPNFRSVVLPTGIGDGLFDIFGFGALGEALLLAHDWAGGLAFDFGAAGIAAFRIAGIEPEAGLDPGNVTAFVTGVTFVGPGNFTGTQTPRVGPPPARPEHASAGLVVAGLVLLGGVLQRRRRAASSRRRYLRRARGCAAS